MRAKEPAAEVDERYGEPGAASEWPEVDRAICAAELFWLSTVRPDGSPHVTPLLSVWLDDAAYFCTGAGEQKFKNLASNAHVVLTTGTNTQSGTDIVLEGDAVPVVDKARLQRLADAWLAKYGEEWRFGVGEGGFTHPSGPEISRVFGVAPRTIRAFGKNPFSQTRFSF